MKYKLKIGPQGHIYLPKRIRETWGSSNLVIFPDVNAAVLAPANRNYEDLLKSLEIIEADIKHRKAMKAKKPTAKSITS